ncbi:5,10-methylenetetrahydrofolate reductase (NAD(P)) [Arboricoccus pini]|uniref:Methylenetetrahydrofolate reductase n=1 Tax=Arboricoccus pini TaxID=1963835 RepID=A0A212QMM0_9PROT|nr:methylenetetrahydrofolate reductase [Arboricoccus pini]SNB60619.1 5,10-methylenetetrahydrofolate reductase (NAD(P)) [Arboricoccus pini]
MSRDATTASADLPPVELSIEIFPPKTAEARERLMANLELFAAAGPRFISVTCGAGGSGEDGTFQLATETASRYAIPVAAHLTCAYASREAIDALVRRYWEQGVRRIVALRGDKPKGALHYQPRPDGYAYANDLVAGLKAIAPFDVSVGCYPETHPEAPDADSDYRYLLRKIEAGADRLITQYCFETDKILRFRDRLVKDGVTVEFVPGIMPIHNFRQIKRFSAACGAGIPDWLEAMFEGVDEASPVHGMVAATVATEQCRRLAAEGLTRHHVYALNRAELPMALVHLLRASSRMPQAA